MRNRVDPRTRVALPTARLQGTPLLIRRG